MQNFSRQNPANASSYRRPKQHRCGACFTPQRPENLCERGLCGECSIRCKGKCTLCYNEMPDTSKRPGRLLPYTNLCDFDAEDVWWTVEGYGMANGCLTESEKAAKKAEWKQRELDRDAVLLKRTATVVVDSILSDDEEDIVTANRAAFSNTAITYPDRVIMLHPNGGLEAGDRFEIEPIDFESTPIKRKATEQLTEADIFSSDDEYPRHGVIPKASNSKRDSPCYRWCITYNNPTIPFSEWCDLFTTTGEWKFFVGQEEIGAQGTPHFQCYGELVRKRRTQQVHALLSPHKVALLYAKGNRASNVAYCSKEDTRSGEMYQWFDEELTKGRGGIKEIDLVAQKVLKTGVTAELIEEHTAIFIRHGKQIKQMAHDHKLMNAKANKKAYWKEQYRRSVAGQTIEGQQQRECYLFFGPTGCGKTTKVELIANGELDLNMYKKDGRTKWFDGYDNEEAIFIDEFNGTALPIETINDLTNKDDTFQAEIKGGAATVVATHLFFASNRHPSDWWKLGEADTLHWPEPRYQALCRRFKKVFWWDDEKHLTVLENPNLFSALDAEDLEAKTKAWKDFWRWKHAPVSEGYSFVAGDEKYFTLYN